ncbi:MAG: glycyl-radical enzyme activating protein [Thermoguttaceae bacterium]
MGVIFDIKKFAIHDGPGIRTTVFLKGCQLRCPWCHNPESICPTPEHLFRAARCLDCGRCFEACDTGALWKDNGRRRVDQDKCTLCGDCAEACPSRALEISGRLVDAEEVIKEIAKDIVFYDESDGGVTFSGGEPYLQAEFLGELLAGCKASGIHTAVDTTCHVPWKIIEATVNLVDLFLVDLKHMDPVEHERCTGVSNELILENIRRLDGLNVDVIIRIPLMEGVNDDGQNMAASGEFISSLGSVARLDLLPYNEAAGDKFTRLMDDRRHPRYARPSNERIGQIAEDLRKYGFNVTIGG